MGDGAVLHDGEICRHRNAVVGPERRPIGHKHVPLPNELDRIPGEIVHLILVLLAHHVKVSLEDKGTGRFVSRGSRLFHHHAPELVGFGLQSKSCCRAENIFRHCRLILGAAGDLGDRREVLPDEFRLQAIYCSCHKGSFQDFFQLYGV